METTEFSGAPQGDDSRPDATAPEADMGFFAPAPPPSTAVDTSTMVLRMQRV